MVVLIALALGFVFLKASPSNTIVSHVHQWAHWLVGPFNGMFRLRGANGSLALNWAIAAVVYLVAATLPARLVTRLARR